MNCRFRSTTRAAQVVARLLMVLSLGLLLVCAAGCRSADQPPETGLPPLGPVPQLTIAQDVTLPLDAYRPTVEQTVTIETARDLLTRDCMRHLGFEWVPQRRTSVPEPGRRYGISNPDEVAQFGYRLPPHRAGAAKPPTAVSPSAEEYTAATGRGPSTVHGTQVPAGGCIGEATRELGYDVTVLSSGAMQVADLPQALDNQAYSEFQADPRLAEVHRAWSDCMNSAGYHYATPWAAQNDPAFSGPAPSPTEITTARADLTCRNTVNLAGISLAIESAHQNKLIERNAEALRIDKDHLVERIRKATDLVASGK